MTASTLAKRKRKANSFTLVELLVVISIIGILAGLAIPGIQAGLDKAKQQVDVSNARQCGLILFADANDNEGVFSTNSATSLQVFQALIAQGQLNNVKVLAGNGFRAAPSTNNVSADNVAWGYVRGLSTSDDGMIPLLISKGIAGLQDVVSLAQVTTGWKQKGAVVYRVGNSAEFLRSGASGVPVGSVKLGLEGMSLTNTIAQ